MPARTSLMAVAALMSLSLAACGQESASTKPPAASEAVETPADSGAETAGASAEPRPTVIVDRSLTPGPGPAPSGKPRELTAAPDPATQERASVLTSMKVTSYPAFDRIVLTFNRGLPGYRVMLADQVTKDPSGEPLDLPGASKLLIVLQGATLNNVYQGGTERYSGPERLGPLTGNLRMLAVAGDFESVLSIGGGLSKAAPFRVSTATGPSSITIDVAR